MVALVIIIASVGVYGIIWDLWRGEAISTLESLFATLIVLVIVIAIGFVIRQRRQMKKTEKFRREKW